MATSLYELYSKRGDYLRATGDIDGFVLNTEISLGMYEMAARSNYHTGWVQRAIEALQAGLPYANEALKLQPSSVHAADISKKKLELETLLGKMSDQLQKRQGAVSEFCDELRNAGISFANNGDPIWNIRGLKAYVLAMSDTVPSVVYSIIRPGFFGPYKDIWKQDVEVFWELSSFLAYYFGTRSLPENSVIDKDGLTVMNVLATIWRPADRVHSMIKRFWDLMRDPQEMKDRRMLWWTHPGADDDNARNTVYEFIVNEIINGPDLGGDFDNPKSDPADGMFLKTYMQNIAIEHIKALRQVASGLQITQ